ncbi:RALBP1 [Bugula neritina]|uniref:RALBP1 n=1 Tax=Bugula neritina TaxID=10212 RepID=A0A7J7KBM4_BUGNE|nr:RALBP1 [Bugula neritina]
MSDSEKNFSGSADESSKPPLLVKKKKKSEKPGYKMFDAEDSDDAPVMFDDSVRPSSTKLKKHGRPSFKFSGKIKLKEKEKEDKKDIGDKRDEKGLQKDYYSKTQIPSIVAAEIPVFGVALSLAVERTPSHDGIMLPVIVRECIDYIEEHGLLYEGIYRISGVKSKVQMLKDAYNRQQPAYLFEHDPSIVASLLKQFLRELPEPLLTNDLNSHFEEASVLKTSKERLERLNQCISSLPPCNRELLSWMIVHMNHVIAKV